MTKHIHPKKAKAARGAGVVASRAGKPPTSKAQCRRARQQTGVAESLAAEAEELFPSLRVGVLIPENLVLQAQHVFENAKLCTERHAKRAISKNHKANMIRSVRLFAKALQRLGIKVLGLRRVKQSHYLDVMALWEKEPPGEARRVGWILSHLRRTFIVIGEPDVIPRGARNKKVLSGRGMVSGTDAAFLVNNYVDWASTGVDVEKIFQTITDPGKRVGARLIYFWGMSLLEVAKWQAVNPDLCTLLRLEGIKGRRCSRQPELSLDPAFAARQISAVREAWNYCRQHDMPSICPSHVSPEEFAEQLRMMILRALKKQFPDRELSPMELAHGFFCQVFADYAGISLQEARKDPWLALKDRRLARGWNEAKRQIGVKGAKAAHGHDGMTLSESQNAAIALDLRSLSPEFAKLCVRDAWLGDVDASAGKCLFIQLQDGAQASLLTHLQELIEDSVVVKLRVFPVQGSGDVPDNAARVMMRAVPVLTRPRITAPDHRRVLGDHLQAQGVRDTASELSSAKDSALV